MITRTDAKGKVWSIENEEHASLISQVRDAYENLSEAMVGALGNELTTGYGVYAVYSATNLNGKAPSDFSPADHTHSQYYLIKDTVDMATQLFSGYLPPQTLHMGDVSSYGASYMKVLCPTNHNHDSRYWKKHETVKDARLLGNHPSSLYSKKDHSHSDYYHKRETALRTWSLSGNKSSEIALANHDHDQTYYLVDETVVDAKGIVATHDKGSLKKGTILFGSDFAPHNHDHPQYMHKVEADETALHRNGWAQDAYSIRTRLFIASKDANGTHITEPIKNPLVRFIPLNITMPLTRYLPSYEDAYNADKDAVSHHGSTDVYLPNMNFAEPYSAEEVAKLLGTVVDHPTSLEPFSQDPSVDNVTTDQRKSIKKLNELLWFKNKTHPDPNGPWVCIGVIANVGIPPREMSWWDSFWQGLLGLFGQSRPENLIYGANPYAWSVHIRGTDYWRIYAQGDFIEKHVQNLKADIAMPSVIVSLTGAAIYIRRSDSDDLPIIPSNPTTDPSGTATITSPTDNCPISTNPNKPNAMSVTGTSQNNQCDVNGG